MKKPLIKLSDNTDILLFAASVFISALVCAYILMDTGASLAVFASDEDFASGFNGSLFGMTEKLLR